VETTARFMVRDYDLAATLTSGQAFRWRRVTFAVSSSGIAPDRVNAGLQTADGWEGVIHGRWVRLRQVSSPPPERSGVDPLGVGCSMPARNVSGFDVGCSSVTHIQATTLLPQSDWNWLMGYLRLNDDHAAMLATFPQDAPMRVAISHCRGLRLLRQEPWECLASFILSSNKQIVQIQQCIELLCERFGEPVGPVGRAVLSPPSAGPDSGCGAHGVPRPAGPRYTFPTASRLAAASEAELRACKIGFRAKYLLAAACMVASGALDLATLEALPLDPARAELMRCPGVGPKIADCTLLFSCGFDAAFPIDVWVERALRRLYFPKRRVKRARLERFAATHFGPHAGLAQQYLFHYLRTGTGSVEWVDQ
jgi:N-glycosylase/DNA lyase